MGRRPFTYRDAGGNVNIRSTVTDRLWAIVVKVGWLYAKRYPGTYRVKTDERAGLVGLSMLFEEFDKLIGEGDLKWMSNPMFHQALREIKDGNWGVVAGPEGKIDINLLHKTTKLKSGFVGVYANGQGFRAMGKDFAGKTIVIGTFQTAEEAAYRRRLHYKINNYAYGELEEEMQKWRDDPGWGAQDYDDRQLIAAIKDHLGRMPGGMNFVFGPNCCTIEPVFPDEPEDIPRPKGSKLPTREEAFGGRGNMVMANIDAERRRLTELATSQGKPDPFKPKPKPEAKVVNGVRVARDPDAIPAGSVMPDPYNPEMPPIPEKKNGYIDMTGRPRPVKSAIAPGETPVSFDGVVALGFEDGDLPPGVLDE